jgi:hypothetical protein
VRAAAANNLGNIDSLLKHWDEATREYESALKAGARPQTVHYNLGVAEYLAGHGGEARRHLQKSGTPEAKKLLVKLGLAQAEPRRPARTAATATAAPPTAPVDSSDAAEGLRGAPGEARIDPADVLIWMK